MFDKIAKQELGNAHFPYRLIHAFHSTFALFDKMCDCAHYVSDAKMPQLLDFIDQIRRASDISHDIEIIGTSENGSSR